MTPLRWPAFYRRAQDATWLERWFMPHRDYARVTQDLHQQLLARPEPDPGVWGDDPLRQWMGQLVCRRIQEQYSWPNAHFLPDDPVEIVFLFPWDDLEIVEFAIQMEEDLGIELKDSEVSRWSGPLRSVVDMLITRYRGRSSS